MTVVVPTYRGARFLDESLASVAAQDLDGVEVLVADDRSDDDTLDVAESYRDRIETLRVEVNEGRLGAAANLNRCVRSARGRWIKPVFQDDLLHDGALDTMRRARRRGVPLVIAARRYLIGPEVPTWQREACEHLVERSLCRRYGTGVVRPADVAAVALDAIVDRTPHLNFIGEPIAVLLERRAVLRAGGFEEAYAQIWDYELPLRLALRRGAVLIDEELVTFRVHGESETARNFEGSAFATNVGDRLQIHVAAANDRAYGPLRIEATRREPPVDLTAMAAGAGIAARHLVEELPEAERTVAASAIEPLVSVVPTSLDDLVGDVDEARNTAIALLLELSSEPLPAHVAPPSDQPAVSDVAEAAVDQEAPPQQAEHPAGGTGSKPVPWPLRRARGAARALRTDQWWGHMLGPIVAFATLQMGWRAVEPGEALTRLLALMATAVVLVAYGYVVNDTADVVPDRLVGKSNSMARFSVPARVSIVGCFALLGALPWFFVPLEAPAIVALAGAYLIPPLYSLRPVRLKERHVLGPLADASNAFAVPALFTIALFAPLGEAQGPAWVMVAGAIMWTYGFGLRAILKHQVDDAGNDRRTGTVTLVTTVGPETAVLVMRRVLFPLELAGFVLLTATVVTWSWWIVAASIGSVVLFHALRFTGVIDRGSGIPTLERGWWMYWHQIWPALLLSVALTSSDPSYAWLIAFVVILFWARVRIAFGSVAAGCRHEWARQRARLRSR